MDLQDFEDAELYFDAAQDPEVAACLEAASEQYAEGTAEASLLRAQELAPENLMVLVGLYRFYYYQHRYPDAMGIAARVMDIVGRRLSLPVDWPDLQAQHVEKAMACNVGLLRFYLLALKGRGYLCLRAGQFEDGKRMLAKVVQLDAEDRLGAKVLLNVLAENDADILPFPKLATVEARS